jgi:folate-binding protein YgfZ
MVIRGGRATFGDVTGEYLALRNRAAYVTDWHDLVWVRGPDAVTFLDGLVSQSVASTAPGHTAPSLLLAPQGKLRAPHVLLRGEGEIGLLADSGIGEVAVTDLTRFKIRVDVVIAGEHAPVVSVWGPRAADAINAAGATVPAAGWQRNGDVVVIAAPFRLGALPRFVTIGIPPGRFEEAGVVRAGSAAADAVRIELGEAVMGIDIDEGTIPQEAGIVDGAVDFAKGCYLGQELVARIDTRGHVNRHMRGIVVASNVLPPVGAEVVSDGKAVGHVTSVAESLELRAPVGLALLRKEAEPGAVVTVRWDGGETPARVAALPLDGW